MGQGMHLRLAERSYPMLQDPNDLFFWGTFLLVAEIVLIFVANYMRMIS